MPIAPAIFAVAIGAGTAAVAVAGVLLAVQETRRQQREWAKWAADRGWRHESHSMSAFLGLRAEPFGKGLSQAVNVITGTWDGLPFTMYHFTRRVGLGRSSKTYLRTVAQFRCAARFPSLTLRHGTPPTLRTDLDFESADFNRAYEVLCEDERFAHSVVHPRLMAALLDGPLRQANVSLEAGTVTVWCEDHLMRASGTRLPRQLAHLVGLIPAHVWRDHGAEVPVRTDQGPGPAATPDD